MATTQPSADPEPAPPADLATYVREGVERQDPETLRAIAAWCEDLAEHREQQPIEAGDDEEIVEVEGEDGDGGNESDGTIVSKKIPCGPGCEGCPHGPYSYRVKRVGDGHSWEYLGRTDAR